MSSGYVSVYMIEGESLTVAQIAVRVGQHKNTVYKFLRRCHASDTGITWAQFPQHRRAAKAHEPPAPKPRKPSRSQQFVLGTAQPLITAAKPRTAPLPSVAEFVAKGGCIQQLGPHDTSNPLRFDHSRTALPIGRRRASVRARKAASQ